LIHLADCKTARIGVIIESSNVAFISVPNQTEDLEMKKIKLGISLIILLLFTITAVAKINFLATSQDKIDLEELDIDKSTFLGFVKSTVINRPPGLGNYGRVSFYPCDIEVGGLKLIEYKSMDGKEIRFYSNPSCHQTVLQKVLENSYGYKKANLSSYQSRQCVLSVEKIISPMLEYYTIKYEERQNPQCSSCEFKEKERLSQILATQKKILQHCKGESDNVMGFINDLDSIIEEGFKAKQAQ
jgi:hypothetical protein